MKNILSPKGTLQFIEYSFIAIGIICITVALVLSSRAFIRSKSYTQTTGTIIENTHVPSGKRSYYSPIISFVATDKTQHTFQASLSNTRVMFPTGTSVELLYDKNYPETAFLKVSVWYNLIPTILGIIFFTIGYVMRFLRKKKIELKDNLAKYGVQVSTTNFEIRQYKNVSVNSINPWVIYATIQHPVNSNTYRCKSEFIYFDPTQCLPEKVVVVTDANDPQKYFVDLSFLPKEV